MILHGIFFFSCAVAKTQGACQLPGNAKCFSASAPVGFTGNACCAGYRCLPWVEAGSTHTGSEDWYCQQPGPLAENSLCGNKQGQCGAGLTCMGGVCSRAKEACQLPGDSKCFSATAPIGFTGGSCCDGSKCLPWIEAGANFTGSEDWYCQYSDPLPDTAQCGKKQGQCSTGLSCVGGVCTTGTKENFQLNIVHMNDIHAHFDEISLNAGRCKQEQLVKDECFGGTARMFTAINQFMDLSPSNTLLLNAGDYFQGTMWFSEFKYEPVVKFGNILNWTAMGLGNHDFDLGAVDLADFSRQTNFDLLASNLEQDKTDANQINFKASKVMEVNGVKIGIIGYITSNTPNITGPKLPTLTFLDEIESVQKEAKRLKSLSPPIDILIALGHAGYEKDKEIAEKVPEVDIVV